MGNTLQFAELLQEGVPWLYPASYVTTACHNTFELMGTAHGRSPTSSFRLRLLFSDALREREAAVSRYRTLFTAFETRPQEVLLGLRDCRLYIAPHVQGYLVGLDSDCEHLTRWALAVQNALRTDAALPRFAAAGAVPPEGKTPASESDLRVRGQMDPGDTAGRVTENSQIARGSDVMPLERSGIPLTQPQRRFSNTWSDRVYVSWCERWADGYNK